MKAPIAVERGPWQRRGCPATLWKAGANTASLGGPSTPCLGDHEPTRGVVASTRPWGVVTQQETRATGLSLTLLSSGWRPCCQEPAPPVTPVKRFGLTADCVAGNEDRALCLQLRKSPL